MRIRSWARQALTVGIATMLLVGGQSAAWADPSLGSDNAYAGGGHQYGFWDAFGHNKPWFRGWVQADGLANNRCQDLFFDWEELQGHHWDARVVRVCRDNGYRETDPGGNGFLQENEADRQLIAIARGGGCVWDSANNDYGGDPINCEFFEDAATQFGNDRAQYCYNTNWTLGCWVRWPGGSVDYYDGGKGWSSSE